MSLALVGVCGAALLALLASRAPEPVVLTLMAALATVGAEAAYWDEAFAREWDRLEPQLVAEIDEAERTLADRGLYALLDGQPELRIDRAAGVITRRSPRISSETLRPGAIGVWSAVVDRVMSAVVHPPGVVAFAMPERSSSFARPSIAGSPR